MTTPNIVNVTTINGLTAVQSVAATATAIIANPAGSNSVYKVDSLMIANIDTAGHSITIDIYRGTTAYPISYSVPIDPYSVYDALSKYIFLNEGDSLRLTGDTANKFTAVASYTVIS